MTEGSATPWFRTAADSQRGSALLVVLLMLGLIAALASVIARSVSGAALTLGAARMSWQAEADLRAGVELGVATILQLGEDLRSADASVNLANRRIAVRVTNERARIDLNAASAPLLAQLLQSSGVAENEAAALAARVIEWRDGSDPAFATAAEDGSSSPGVAPAEPGAVPGQAKKQARHFLHPWQLTSVPGFSKPLVRTVQPLVTVANASDQIDPYISDERVLRALPGVSPGSVDAFLGARDGNTSREAAIQILGVPKKHLTADASQGWRIEISTHMQSGSVRRCEAVIALLEGDNEPYRVLYVLDDLEQPSPLIR
jgi:general secretion pathway protein K